MEPEPLKQGTEKQPEFQILEHFRFGAFLLGIPN